MMKFIDRLPMVPFALIAVLLALLPVVPEPHLWEKLKMLAAGELAKPLDIFDLFMHGVPLLVLIVKVLRLATGAASK